MKNIAKQINQLLITATLTLCITTAIAQKRDINHVTEKQRAGLSQQLKAFYRRTAEANVSFTFPKEFIEVKAPDNEYFSFDYAMELPGKDFEIWFQVRSEKENWASYIKTQTPDNQNVQTDPDSLYSFIGVALATTFTGDKTYLVRKTQPNYLAPFNADVGKSYLLTLLDLPDTKGYKYALMFTIHKFHAGTIIAVCFTNTKGLDFFNNINMVKNCLRFNP